MNREEFIKNRETLIKKEFERKLSNILKYIDSGLKFGVNGFYMNYMFPHSEEIENYIDAITKHYNDRGFKVKYIKPTLFNPFRKKELRLQ